MASVSRQPALVFVRDLPHRILDHFGKCQLSRLQQIVILSVLIIQFLFVNYHVQMYIHANIFLILSPDFCPFPLRWMWKITKDSSVLILHCCT